MTEGLARWVLALAAALALGGCDPYPVVKLVNETPTPVGLRFAPITPGDDAPPRTFQIQPGKSARFPAGWIATSPQILRSGDCDYAFDPVRPSDPAIDNAYGAVTTLKVSADLRLHVHRLAPGRGWRRALMPQPPGWPRAPKARICR